MKTLTDTLRRAPNRHTFIWHACIDCGKEGWTLLKDIKKGGRPRSLRCRSCAGKLQWASMLMEKHPRWKGGRTYTRQGYIIVRLPPSSFFYPMSQKGGKVLEHRLVMAKHLGRCLQRWEEVHHKNGIKGDNRIENLKLMIQGSHITEHTRGYRDGYRKGFLDGQSKLVQELKTEIRLLRWELKERQNANTQ